MKDARPILEALSRNRYVLLVFALGLTLLLLPRPRETESAAAAPVGGALPLAASGLPMDTEELRLARALSRIRNVGAAEVLLSREGAIVICEGADDPVIRLAVTDAVSLYTGLGSDRIQVVRMQPAKEARRN